MVVRHLAEGWADFNSLLVTSADLRHVMKLLMLGKKQNQEICDGQAKVYIRHLYNCCCV
jgi:hypothetical protein